MRSFKTVLSLIFDVLNAFFPVKIFFCISIMAFFLFISFYRSNTQLPNSQISRFFSQPNASDNELATDNVAPEEKDVDKCTQDKPSFEIENEKRTIDISDEKQSVVTKTNMERKKTKSVQRTEKYELINDSKSTIKSFFSNDKNESMADFEIPAKIAKRPPSKPVPSKTAKNSRARRKQPDIRKVLNKRDTPTEDYSYLPEDAQLELALAMSKATAEALDKPINLEAFEFKPTNSKLNGECYKFFNMMPKKTNARFKWNSKCTQLTRRKDEVQKSKVRDRIDELLLNNIIVESSQSKQSETPAYFIQSEYTPYDIYSKHLQRVCVSERILFEINGCEMQSKGNILSYYTNNLVERSKLKAGVLLRDWSKIPGRDSIYDGIANEINKTDATVILSQSEPTCDGIDGNNEHELKYDMENEEKNAETEQQYLDYPMESLKHQEEVQFKNDNENYDIQIDAEENRPIDQIQELESNQNDAVNSDDDANATAMMDSDDIQLKVDVINSKIRLSQNFSDILQPTVVTYDTTSGTIRAPSPDLFDDDYDYEMTDVRGKSFLYSNILL